MTYFNFGTLKSIELTKVCPPSPFVPKEEKKYEVDTLTAATQLTCFTQGFAVHKMGILKQYYEI